MIKGVGHVAFATRDLEESVRFYTSSLDLEEAFRLENDDGTTRAVYIRAGRGQFIELFPPGQAAQQGSPPPSRGLYRHLCLVVEGFHDFVAVLRERGVPLVTEPKRGVRDGNWQVFVEDPDGNRIEIMEIDPSSPQARSE